MKFKGKVVNVELDYLTHKPKLTLELQGQESIFSDEFNKLQSKELIEIELKEVTKQRGLQANRYFHKLINELAKYNRSKGFAISDDEMKINMNVAYGTLATDETGQLIGAKVPRGTDLTNIYPYARKYKEDGKLDCYIFYKRTSELNTKEFWQLIKGVEVECQKVGIEILEEKEFKKMMENYEKEYGRRNKSE